ncbi:hypothetical protein M409DRAFT_25753 [Zasmidium cellare ATCC 36951]|uniref:Aminoglycoside phosphotransferase domain-containing protein n=1 Tax=Zasmidium cellare ATCC 36951 TaxID=1080233 RepID=A0A6A6CEA1_ZASCE|nr:uncharacterized protein M409DRAFT_25753 [Zasmidium cellare ATCC 36951]KAF2163979.1 hypothetical protein M409DRAFT_25753 [Zasmidium cellare ATCC 36951]
MWQPVPLPYITDKHPVTLPTPSEIRACTDVLDTRRRLGRVVAIDDRVVVKFGNVAEGQALVYLERYVPEVRAPRLYAMYYDEGRVLLVMERVQGVQLEEVWGVLSEGEKDGVVEQLGQILRRLRGAECPWDGGFLGGVDGGGVRHDLFVSEREGDHWKHLGPFRDERAFVEALAGNYRAHVSRNGHSGFKAGFWQRHLGDVIRGHRTVLTHGDLHRRNILLVEKRRCERTGERVFEVVLVDWESAGWGPEFWECFCASVFFRVDGWDDEWCLRVGEFAGVYLAEAAVMREFHRDFLGW